VNLAKQVNILLENLGVKLDKVIIDGIFSEKDAQIEATKVR